MMAWLRGFLGGAGALALLPLSVVPMLLVGPSLVHSHSRFQRTYDSAPYAPPAVLFTPATVARYTPVAPFRGAVPVLAYHGINDNNDHYSVSREEFARQLAMLAQAQRTLMGPPSACPTVRRLLDQFPSAPEATRYRQFDLAFCQAP